LRLDALELRRISLPLVTPFRSASGTEAVRDILLVRAIGFGSADGWAECAALAAPSYTSEYVEGAHRVIREHLAPLVLGAGDLAVDTVAGLLAPVRGHPMAKAAVETAILDAELRAAGVSLSAYLGGVRTEVDAGVSLGIAGSLPELLAAAAAHVELGYRRVKLKIQPGWDLEPVRAVRDHLGDQLMLQVDANGAYAVADAGHLALLDPYGLALIEQPLAPDDLLGHAELGRRIATPICLDESITSARDAATAITLGACSIVNVKPGRVGGYLEARRVHDVCVAHGVAAWCGGMLETGIGRAANLALAALPGFTLPGDLSASDRYYRRDITEPFRLHGGRLRVPDGPGIGVVPEPAALKACTTSVEVIR